MNKHQKAINSIVKSFDAMFASHGLNVPFSYTARRKYIKEVLIGRSILSVKDILATKNKIKKLIVNKGE